MNTATTQTPFENTGTEVLPEHMQIALKPAVTRGEKTMHFFAHWVVNFFVNYVLSVGITDIFLGYKEKRDAKGNLIPNSFLADIAGDGKFGQQIRKASDFLYDKYESSRNWIKNSLVKANVSEKLSGEIAGDAANVFTLMMGGHFTSAWATGILNNSDKWSRRFDKMHDALSGHKPSAEEMAQREARYEFLRNQPKKTAWTVIKSRILGFAMNNFSTIITKQMDLRRYIPGVKERIEQNEEKTGVRAITQSFGNTISSFVAAKQPNMSESRKARVNFWSELALAEVFFTFNTSLALRLLTGGHKKETQDPHPPGGAMAKEWEPVISAKVEKPAQKQEEIEGKAGAAPDEINEMPGASKEKAISSQKNRWSAETKEKEQVKPREEVKPRDIRQENTATVATATM